MQGRTFISFSKHNGSLARCGIALAERFRAPAFQSFSLTAFYFSLCLDGRNLAHPNDSGFSLERLFSASHINEIARTILFLQIPRASPSCQGILDRFILRDSEKLAFLRAAFSLQSSSRLFQHLWPNMFHRPDAKTVFATSHQSSLRQPCRTVMTSCGVNHFLFREASASLVIGFCVSGNLVQEVFNIPSSHLAHLACRRSIATVVRNT